VDTLEGLLGVRCVDAAVDNVSHNVSHVRPNGIVGSVSKQGCLRLCLHPSHHIAWEEGFKGICIGEMTPKYDCITRRIATLLLQFPKPDINYVLLIIIWFTK